MSLVDLLQKYDVLIYLPERLQFMGLGSQLNHHLAAALVAGYLGRALVVLDPPAGWSRYESGSQFGCPEECFGEADGGLQGGALPGDRAGDLRGSAGGLRLLGREPAAVRPRRETVRERGGARGRLRGRSRDGQPHEDGRRVGFHLWLCN